LTWAQCVNEQLGSAGIGNVGAFLAVVNHNLSSPIDEFYNALDLLLRAGEPQTLAASPILGPLITIGIISATENYLRGLFAGILKICPAARRKAGDQNINFGSVLWHGTEGLERGAFEKTPFSDIRNIQRATENFLAHNIRNGPLADQLQYFDTICELRHCIVHSSGQIQGTNAIALGLTRTRNVMRVQIGFGQVQEVGEGCAGFVRSFNTEMFSVLGKRWAIEWRRLPSWRNDEENKIFKRIWELCHSTVDRERGSLSPAYTMVKCRNLIRKEFGI
jgi:hypothetical protein